jgi:2-oxoglutarate dehydrogenase E2 component (dihydrolipoamide succinyltransferase)
MTSNIVVPEVGESIVDARIAKWLRKEGDVVSAGDPLVELETDKIDLEVSAPQAGVLSRIDRKDGDDVKVGEVLGVIDGSAAAGATGVAAHPSDRRSGSSDPEKTDRTPGSSDGAKAADTSKTRATPTARKAAEEHEVDLRRVRGSGDAGRVMRRDVEAASAAPSDATAATAPRAASAAPSEATAATAPRVASAAPSAGAAAQVPAVPVSKAANARPSAPSVEPVERPAGDRAEERVRMSKRRATIAKRLVEAQSTAAMLSTFNEVDMSAVMALRARHKQPFKDRHGVGLGIASFFIKAAVGALREFPRINAEIQGDEMVLKRYFDIGVAVGASEGLVVPVLRDVDRMSFAQIEKQIRDFASRAEDGTLALSDLKGGTFTITNGGVFGSLLSTPILNPPQVGILGLHKIQERPIAMMGEVVVRPMMYMALTYDHRIVDGSEAVRFLVRVKELVEDPAALLLE